MIIEVESRSARRTKSLFKEAFLRLIQKDSYSLITVKEIVDEAEYNRSTFYKHYLDKEDLLEELINDVVDGLADAVEKTFRNYEHNEIAFMKKQDVQLFHYVYANRSAFTLWNQSALALRCTEAIYHKLYELWTRHSPESECTVEAASRVMSYQLMGMIHGWLLNGFQSKSEIITKEFINFYRAQNNN